MIIPLDKNLMVPVMPWSIFRTRLSNAVVDCDYINGMQSGIVEYARDNSSGSATGMAYQYYLKYHQEVTDSATLEAFVWYIVN